MADKTAKMAITANISIKVKPFLFFLFITPTPIPLSITLSISYIVLNVNISKTHFTDCRIERKENKNISFFKYPC